MNNANKPLILGVGEILWDVFPTGACLGGAPTNFACAAAGLGGDRVRVGVVSCVGRDSLGNDAIRLIQEKNVDITHIGTSDKVTGQVIVELDDQGVASYRFAEDAAWDHLRWTESMDRLATEVAVVCFGSLGQRAPASRETIQRFVQNTTHDCLRLFDVNLRYPFVDDNIIDQSLEIANALKLNDEELEYFAERFALPADPIAALDCLLEKFQLSWVALTRGSQGATLAKPGEFHSLPALKTEVVDTVGAGDAFSAVLALGILDQKPFSTILEEAIRVASYVCSHRSATPTFERL
jgi:fructokinase